MNQEDKELLLKDLCARLPYGVHCCVLNLNKTIRKDNDIIYGIFGDNIVTLKSDKNECYMYYQIKPYLRSMSSMTEEEKKEFDEITLIHTPWGVQMYRIPKLIDWLNAHHFDYRGLIEKGLAIEAPKGFPNDHNLGRYDMCKQMLSFINTLEAREVDLKSNSFDATMCKIGSTYLKEMERDAIVKALEPYKNGDKVKVNIKAQKGEKL